MERWLEAARPCATLASTVDGPVVDHFGGPHLLPADAPPLPAGLNLMAMLDLAALPDDATTRRLWYCPPTAGSSSSPGSVPTTSTLPAG
ncbi:hypothetical protein ACFQ9U_06365 [Streptomyces sp. NPDC056568]|uniref:hypothetical protein n=1 Tax=Streptomyces sp. NPDC056568 TaxID=3345866 RepID=UPI003697CD40